MASKSNTLSKQLRYQKWISEVQDCINRPADMSVEEWCTLNGLKYSTYYRYQLLVKEMCLDQMEAHLPTATQGCDIIPTSNSVRTFVGPKVPEPVVSNDSISISCGKAKIELNENVSESFLIKLFGAMNSQFNVW